MNFFITGGSRGIGAEIVRNVLKAGHNVAFTYVSRGDMAAQIIDEAKIFAPECLCKAYELNVSDRDAIERVGDKVLDDFEDMHVVINNAAVNRMGMAMSMSNEDWEHSIDVNLSAPFYVSRHFLPVFLANGWGRFIHISSVAMHGMAGLIGYSASKAGLSGLSSTLAKEYGPKGITSNLLVLGFFDTDMTREQMPEHQKIFWKQFCPAKRMGELREISDAVLYLSSEGSGFMNGEALVLAGGMNWSP